MRTPELELRHVDLELATRDYRPRGMAEKPPQDSRSMGTRKTHRVCAACSTNTKSPQGSSRYEHLSSPSRCSRIPWLHRSGSPLSLHRSDAFRLLRGTSIPRLHGSHWGKRTTTFWNKLHTKKHARTECFPKSGTVYHLFSRRLYRQIDRENIRNRREHEIEFIQQRIGMLDFVLLNPGVSVP